MTPSEIENMKKGPYAIVVLEDSEMMGQMIKFYKDEAWFFPWNFFSGGFDRETKRLFLPDCKEVICFDDANTMDIYFHKNYWLKKIGETHDAE